MGQPDLTVVENFNPGFALGRLVLGDEYKLDNDDYLELIKGTIGCIPVVGALATSVFSIFWKKAFPTEDPYLRKEDFEKRMKKLITDMENKMDKKIDDEIVKFCQAKFESLCSAGFGFSEIEYIYDKQKRDGKPTSDAVKMYMAANHVSFRNLLLECLIFFSREDKIDLLCKLYLQTVVMYIAFLRDTHFYGIDWGLPEEYVNGVDHIKSMESKIHETIELAHGYYSKFFKKLNPPRNYTYETEMMITDESGLTYMGYPPTKFKCDYRPLLAQMTYADLTRYNLNQIWLQPTTKEGKVRETKSGNGILSPDLLGLEISMDFESYEYRLPVSNRIYIADFSNMNVMRGFFRQTEDGRNSVNSVTGTVGMSSGHSNGLFYKCFYFTEPKNLTFRVLANIDSNAQIKMVIREIPEGQIAENPDRSREVATKTHSENVAYKKLFESSSCTMAEFVSKQYQFEQPGSVYFEAEVVGGDTRDLYTLEIIGN
ncbi:hypothetical protein CYY_003042 [Polysphondylium violaceum]|uniref:Pesticidal crystal protein N-terminal domain-containing protein n=1 Tax=Polysphondylium violaceum TaxID=133409 RepID=A0A8J4Q0M2_9MYCE|nr:hypothetical protein CYY_003042 [Polysphondylium violaceum]